MSSSPPQPHLPVIPASRPALRVLFLAAIAAAYALVIVVGTGIAMQAALGGWWIPVALIAGLAAADFVSGLVQAIDRNFAVHTPIWDLVFGTYYLPDRWPHQYGLAHGPGVPRRWTMQFLHPFRRRRDSEPL